MPGPNTDETRLLARFQKVTNLLLLAGTAAASLGGSVSTERERDQAANVAAAIDGALVELRRIIVRLTASGTAGPTRGILGLPAVASPSVPLVPG